MVDGPLTVIIEALWVTVALTALVLGCAVDGSWWSLLTATCYVLALGVWSLFRPGCMPCVAAAGTLDMSAGAGCCGGQLWAAWGAWLTSFLATSTFGVAFTLFHNNAVRAFPGSCTLVTRVPTLPPSPPAPPAQGSPRVSLCCRGADCLVCLCACVLVCLCACVLVCLRQTQGLSFATSMVSGAMVMALVVRKVQQSAGATTQP